MNTPDLPRSELERLRIDFYRRGINIAAWAREHGFKPIAVYGVLNGKSRAARGDGHRIAVALGLKPAEHPQTDISVEQSIAKKPFKENDI